ERTVRPPPAPRPGRWRPRPQSRLRAPLRRQMRAAGQACTILRALCSDISQRRAAASRAFPPCGGAATIAQFKSSQAARAGQRPQLTIQGGWRMARKNSRSEVSRRKFLAGVAVAGAAASATTAKAATPGTTAADVKRLPSALPPTAYQIAAETGVP